MPHVKPFADGCLVRLLDGDPSLPTVTRLILPNTAKDEISSVSFAKLVEIGPGRLCGEARIPNLESLGWAVGDTILCLARWKQWQANERYGPEYKDTLLLNDYDVLARIVTEGGKRRIDPAWGRAVLKPERIFERQALRSKIIVLTPQGSDAQRLPCGEITALAPFLREKTGPTGRAGWSSRATIEFDGVDYDQGIKVGDRVIHARAACYYVYLDGAQFVIINTQAILAVVSPDAYVE